MKVNVYGEYFCYILNVFTKSIIFTYVTDKKIPVLFQNNLFIKEKSGYSSIVAPLSILLLTLFFKEKFLHNY